MKKIINIIMISMVLMCATACSSGTEKSETDAQSEAVIATPTPKPELPEKLHFMNGLDPVKNDDGTYSVKIRVDDYRAPGVDFERQRGIAVIVKPDANNPFGYVINDIVDYDLPKG